MSELKNNHVPINAGACCGANYYLTIGLIQYTEIEACSSWLKENRLELKDGIFQPTEDARVDYHHYIAAKNIVERYEKQNS